MNPPTTTEPIDYCIYVAATRERVWSALTDGDMTRDYFFARRVESDWRAGSRVLYRMPDGSVDVSGRILEIDPPRFIRFTWRAERPGMVLPEAIVSFEIRPFGGMCRLDLLEEHPEPIPVAHLEGGRRGWPIILSCLKTLIETGRTAEIDMIAVMHDGED